MHPYTCYQLTQSNVADLHRQAERRQLAQAARRARGAGRSQTSRRISAPSVVLHRLRAVRPTGARLAAGRIIRTAGRLGVPLALAAGVGGRLTRTAGVAGSKGDLS
jgi:hypothetical protein